jgi:hypothetical protein
MIHHRAVHTLYSLFLSFWRRITGLQEELYPEPQKQASEVFLKLKAVQGPELPSTVRYRPRAQKNFLIICKENS